MAWTTPTARASGAAITEAIWNTDIVDNLNYLKAERDADNLARPIGEIKMWPTTTAPAKFLLCDGHWVSRTGYAALFAVIGTTFGAGDGTTSFALPDMRGNFPLGADNMGGSSRNRVTSSAADIVGFGGQGGAETHTLTAAELAAHNHTVTGSTAAGSQNNFTVIGSRNADYTITTSNNAGGGSAHNNMPPYQTLSFIIYAGV